MLSLEELAALLDLASRSRPTPAEDLFIKACVAKINAAIAEQKQAATKEPDAPAGL